MEDEELTIEEVEIPTEPTESVEDIIIPEGGVAKWLVGLFKAKPKMNVTEAVKVLQAAGYKFNQKELAGMMDDAGAEGEMPMMQKSIASHIIKAQVDAMQEAFKVEREALVKSVQEATEAKYAAVISDLKDRVEKAEKDKAGEVEARERHEYLEKAMTHRALPTTPTDLAEILFQANKTLPAEVYAKLEATLKSADNLLGASRIFSEFGTMRSPEEVKLTEKVNEIAKSQDLPLDEAMLKLSEVDQLKLMAEWDGGRNG